MKKRRETIVAGIISLLISQVLIKIIGLAYKLYLTNKEGFGDSGNAIYSAGFQIYALLLTFSSTGVPNAIARLVSERVAIGDNKGAHNIFKIAFFTFALLGLLCTILLFLGAQIIAEKWLEIPEARYSLITLSPSIFFVSITAVIRGYFNGLQNLSVTAKSQTIEQIFKTLFTIIFVEIVAKFSRNNTMLMAAVANFATTVATCFSFTYIFMYFRLKRKEIAQDIQQTVNYTPTRIRKTLKIILKESIPVSLSSLLSSFNKNIDLFTVVRILKKYMTENLAKAQYGILSGKIDTLCILPLSLNIPLVTGMIPSVARSKVNNDTQNLNRKISIFIETTILIALPATAGMIIFAEPILKLLFPNASEGKVLLQINSVSILFAMLAQTINAALQGIGKKNIPLISYLLGMILKFFTNIVLIGKENIGIKGAAIGNIICNLTVFMIGFIILKKYIELDIKNYLFKVTFITLIMSVLSILLYFNLKRIFFLRLALIVSISVATGIYIVLAAFCGLFKNRKI